MAALLTEDFREYGSSGREYSRTDILAALQHELPITRSLRDFRAIQLSDEAVLVTYRVTREQDLSTESLRSSLWVQREGRWQMLFHQGTQNVPSG